MDENLLVGVEIWTSALASATRHRGIGDKINKHEQFPCSSLQSAVHFWHKITAAFWWQHAIKQLLKYFP